MDVSYELNERNRLGDLESSLQDSLDLLEIKEKIQRLYESKRITYSQAREMHEALAREEIQYVLKNFGIVLTAGIPFAFLPPPIGSFFTSPGRFFWTLNEIRKRKKSDKENVYGIDTALFSAIPWVGPYALLLPLRKENPQLCYLTIKYYIGKGLKRTTEFPKKLINVLRN